MEGTNRVNNVKGGAKMTTDFQFDKKWLLQPIKGDTGQAYMGMSDSEKVFIKRNASPFLAALSREEIAPKLVWTKRTSDGAVLTAQEWLDGHLLKPQELGHNDDVVSVLKHLHESESLKNMLGRVGGNKRTPLDFISYYAEDLPFDLKKDDYLGEVLHYLEDNIPKESGFCACHGDPIHKNWLLSETGKLYLVDWESSMLADPATDLGTILGRYLPYREWGTWLGNYGLPDTQENIDRIFWYAGIDFLIRIKKCHIRQDTKQLNQEMTLLKELYVY